MVILLFMKPHGRALAAQWKFYARTSPTTIYEIVVVSLPYICAAKMDTMNLVEFFWGLVANPTSKTLWVFFYYYFFINLVMGRICSKFGFLGSGSFPLLSGWVIGLGSKTKVLKKYSMETFFCILKHFSVRIFCVFPDPSLNKSHDV